MEGGGGGLVVLDSGGGGGGVAGGYEKGRGRKWKGGKGGGSFEYNATTLIALYLSLIFEFSYSCIRPPTRSSSRE